MASVAKTASSPRLDSSFPEPPRSAFQSPAGLAIIALALLAWLPFLDQAFHIDDTNFLAVAAHVWPHPLELYNFQINWLGEEQRAFDILANPPLGPWYLALVSLVAHGREWVYHLSYWPFLVLTLAGAYRLGRRFAPEQGPLWTMLWTGVAPGLVVAGHAVMPDLPLLACYVMGTARRI
jgi:4-amino-4-deoxy-L-arabinose transferase-like glycosyltransferase